MEALAYDSKRYTRQRERGDEEEEALTHKSVEIYIYIRIVIYTHT